MMGCCNEYIVGVWLCVECVFPGVVTASLEVETGRASLLFFWLEL